MGRAPLQQRTRLLGVPKVAIKVNPEAIAQQVRGRTKKRR